MSRYLPDGKPEKNISDQGSLVCNSKRVTTRSKVGNWICIARGLEKRKKSQLGLKDDQRQ